MRTKKIKKVIVPLLPWAALLIFILIHTGLFFEETKVTDELGKKIEELRPLFFGLSIGACVLGFLHGVFRYKIPFFGADPSRKAKKEGREINEKTTLRKALNAVFAGLLVVGNAILSFFIVELINNPWIEQMADIHILLGCGICLAFFIVFIFLTNSVSIGAVIANVFLTFWACLNYFVLEFRSIPFQWIDIASYRTAMNVASNYHLTMTWQIVVGITGAAFASGILLHMEIFHIFKRWPGKLAA
ncbi:MAG: hypothetical protein ACSW75_01275, partial [Lachnospiraceae bacterium]